MNQPEIFVGINKSVNGVGKKIARIVGISIQDVNKVNSRLVTRKNLQFFLNAQFDIAQLGIKYFRLDAKNKRDLSKIFIQLQGKSKSRFQINREKYAT